MSTRLSHDQVIAKFRHRHGFKYDYSLVSYTGANRKVHIICRTHGLFSQAASKHWSGQGCDKCLNQAQTKTTNQFIEQARAIHGASYDYSLVSYIGAFKKVTIICPSHGIFEQTPTNHTHKSYPKGCPRCRGGTRLSLPEFLELAKNNTKFQGKVIGKYVNWNTLITCNCDLHGEFTVVPATIIHGKGCGRCSGYPRKFNETDFTTKAIKVHGTQYFYDNLNHENEMVTIRCSLHGSFRQNTSAHLRGSGCKRCSKNNVSKLESAWLDKLSIPTELRNKSIRLGGRLFYPDGISEDGNTIFEFLGDYWHGNPRLYEKAKFHPIRKCSFGELYEETREKIKFISQYGLKIKFVWEMDYKNGSLFSETI